MRISEILNEMPQQINTLNIGEVSSGINDCLANINNAIQLEKIDDGVGLYKVQINQYVYYFVYNENSPINDRIEYFVRSAKVDFDEALVPVKPVRQALVWRHKNSVFSAGVAKKVFWNYLFKENKCVVSDSQQTDNGRSFWQFIVSETFQKGMTVRIINTNDKTYTDMTSLKEFADHELKTWGKSKWFQRMIIAIF